LSLMFPFDARGCDRQPFLEKLPKSFYESAPSPAPSPEDDETHQEEDEGHAASDAQK